MGWLTDYVSPAQDLASKGRNGDTMLAHINPQEAALLKSLGGSGTTNPETGLPEFFSLGDIGGALYDATVGQAVGPNSIASKATDALGGWSSIRDSLEAAGVAAGNYFLPGSGLLTSRLVSGGAQDALSSGLGQLAMLGSGLAGGMAGNLGNYGSLADMFSGGNVSPGITGAAETGATVGGPIAPAGVPSASEWGSLGPASAGQASNVPLAETTAAAAPTSYEPLSGIDLGGPGSSPANWGTPSTGLSGAIDWMKANPLRTAMVGSSLYDMYAKKQMASRIQDQMNQQRQSIENFYAPGSPEYNRMLQEAKRTAAAAGRPFNTAQFQAEMAGRIADKKMSALQGMQGTQNQLLASQMGSQYGGLNTLFNNLAMYQLLSKKGLA